MASGGTGVKTWEFIPLHDQTKFKTGWPVHGNNTERSPVLGYLPRKQPFRVTGFNGPWVRAELPNGLTGWTMATYRGSRVLHPVAAPQPRGPKSYGWQRARGRAKNYNEMLERRRAQLRLADLATNPALLEEWYELIKELDAVLRYGFSSQIDPTPTKGGQRKRANSFLDLFKATSAGRTSSQSVEPPIQTRARSNSFSAFFAAKRSEGARMASTHEDDPEDEAMSQLKEQRRQLLEQERQTAKAVAQAALADLEGYGLPAAAPTAVVSGDDEARMRAEAREVARRAILAEHTQERQQAAVSSPPQLVHQDDMDGPRTTVLTPDSVHSATEMSFADIEQIMTGSGTFGGAAGDTGAPHADRPAVGVAAGTRCNVEINEVDGNAMTAAQLAAMRQARVSEGLRRLRAAAAAGSCSSTHRAALSKHGYSASHSMDVSNLSTSEAVARDRAQQLLAQLRCSA
eukprot:m.191705 g.191705  ORF g.191705 m.191705 type:complete len:459 (-) comp18430_c0_seq1:91-1467(-)